MKPLSIDIIPAQPGFLTVYDHSDEKSVEIGDPVIAWRVETYSRKNKNEEFITSCYPITVDGDAPSNCIGVQNPDMTISVFQESYHKSLEELTKTRYPK